MMMHINTVSFRHNLKTGFKMVPFSLIYVLNHLKIIPSKTECPFVSWDVSIFTSLFFVLPQYSTVLKRLFAAVFIGYETLQFVT